MSKEFTLGVEEEFQIIDPETRELKSLISQLIEAHTPMDEVVLQPELHQSVVEVATGICDNVEEVRREVIKNRRAAHKIAQRVGVRIAAASTHPGKRNNHSATQALARTANWESNIIASGFK